MRTKPRVWCEENMLGRQFGRWTVIRSGGRSRHSSDQWLCRCSCDQTRLVLGPSLRTGKSQSCGCYHRELVSQVYRSESVSDEVGGF